MKHPKEAHLITEFITLFVLYPVLLGIKSIPIYIKLGLAPIVLIYLGFACYYIKGSVFKKTKQIRPFQFWKKVSIRLLLIAVATIVYVNSIDSNLLFKALRTQPDLWLKMILIYLFLSVIPQEFVYRVFYFLRYRKLFKNNRVFFFVNALVFSLAHLMFDSLLVLCITFIGGYIFAFTYYKTKSMFWVSVEHLIYGGWLFSVGMGKMLGFPV